MLALPPEVSRTLEETLRAQGISPFALVLTAFEQALAASCQQDDFCVGITVGGRRGTELEQVMGLFVNSLPLRLQPQKGETWMAAARRVQMALAELMEGQDYPLNRVMSAAKLEQPPFNVFFNQDILPGSLTIGGVPAQLVGVDTGTAKFPLVVSLLLLSEQWHWRMEYRSDLLPSDWVRGLGEEVLRLLRRCATWPDMALADLLTLDEELMLLL
jgi:non-ribosomal peptide synthetase component F